MTGILAQRRFAGALLTAGLILGSAMLIPATDAGAQEAQSAYTAMDLDKVCRWDEQTEEEVEEAQGNCAWCPGYDDLQVRFCEGDLRQSIQYGAVDPDKPFWASFGEFNHANSTIEWIVVSGRPVAAIQRFFIENANSATGEIEEALRGQVLVVSTIADAERPVSCPAGYVDARANKDANAIARRIATTIVPGFVCGRDEAQFHGRRSPHAGTPSVYIE